MAARPIKKSRRSKSPANRKMVKKSSGPQEETLTTVPAVWMHPGLRYWLASLRPWSLPASLVPVVLAGTLLAVLRGVDLFMPEFVACIVGAMCVHAAANLFNTYFDFKKGADTKDPSTDDRALVDKWVSPSQVLRTATVLLGLSTVLAIWLTMRTSARGGTLSLITLYSAGALLAVFYTADPFSLKYRGLGDVAITVCFGPLLMEGVAVALVGEFDIPTLVYSMPLGLLTEGILHANNVRDIEADRRAGATTLAQIIGADANFMLYIALLSSGYVLVFAIVAAELFGLPTGLVGTRLVPSNAAAMRLLLVLCTLPWAAHLCGCFMRGRLQELPQKTAQFNLLFGVVLIGALAPPRFFARFMLGCLFYLGGVNNILQWRYVLPLVEQKIGNLWPAGRFAPPSRILCTAALVGAVSAQLACSTLFIFGLWPRLMAQVLLAWLVPVTFIVHDFWTVGWNDGPAPPDSVLRQGFDQTEWPRQRVATFPTNFDNEFVHFFKNVGMIGGLAVFLAYECDAP